MLCAGSRERRHNASHLVILEEDAQLAIACPTVVADHFQVARALPCKSLNQIVRKSGAAKPAEHDGLTVRNICDSSIRCGVDLVFLSHCSIQEQSRRRPPTRLRSDRSQSARGGCRTNTS